MTENEISYIIRGEIFNIYNKFGPGLLESVYENVLAHELGKKNLKVQKQLALPFFYEGIKMDIGLIY